MFWLGIICYFGLIFLLDIFFCPKDNDELNAVSSCGIVYTGALGTARAWLLILLVVGIGALADVGINYAMRAFKPQPWQIVQEMGQTQSRVDVEEEARRRMQMKRVGPAVEKQGQPTAERVKEEDGGGFQEPTRPDAAFPPPSTIIPLLPSPISVIRTHNMLTNTVSLGASNTTSLGTTNFAIVSPALMQPVSHSRPPSAQGKTLGSQCPSSMFTLQGHYFYSTGALYTDFGECVLMSCPR